MAPEEIATVLERIGADRLTEADYPVRGSHLDVTLSPDRIRDAVQALRDREFLIEDVTAVDAAPELMVVYHFHHILGGCRTTLRVLADREDPQVPSVQDIYPGANWHERETHEFYGVAFAEHPDLSPLILPEDAGDLRPLRKEGKGLKALGDVIPEFAPPAPEGDEPPPQEAEEPEKTPATEDEGKA